MSHSYDILDCLSKNDHTYHIRKVSDVDINISDRIISDEKIVNWFYKSTELFPVKMPHSDSTLLNVIDAISYYIWGNTENSNTIQSESIRAFTNYQTHYENRWTNEQNSADTNDDLLIMSQIVKQNHLMQIFLNNNVLKLFIFIFANILRRTIIILSKDDIISGIYLPLLTDPTICVHYPILLCEHSRKFCPLLMDRHFEKIPIIPLFTHDSKQLHISFLLPEERNKEYICELLHSYMVTGNSKKYENSHQYFARIIPISKSDKSKPKEDIVYKAKVCTTEGCDLFGIKENKWKCSKCFKKHLLNDLENNQEIALLELEPEPTAPDFELLTMKIPETNIGEIEKPSMIMIPCRFPKCPNLVSRYTAPFCYDHANPNSSFIGSVTLPTESTTANKKKSGTEFETFPNTTVFPSTSGITIKSAKNSNELMNINEKFDTIMKESEKRTKVAATPCLAAPRGCKNFGNSKCSGYCNECFTLLSKLN